MEVCEEGGGEWRGWRCVRGVEYSSLHPSTVTLPRPLAHIPFIPFHPPLSPSPLHSHFFSTSHTPHSLPLSSHTSIPSIPSTHPTWKEWREGREVCGGSGGMKGRRCMWRKWRDEGVKGRGVYKIRDEGAWEAVVM